MRPGDTGLHRPAFWRINRDAMPGMVLVGGTEAFGYSQKGFMDQRRRPSTTGPLSRRK